MTDWNCPCALVVDDVADTADSLGMLLELWGYRAKVCYGGAAALVAARVYRPQVVLLDIGMPVMNGFQVAIGLRAMRGLEGVIVIGISGHTSEDYRALASNAGFDHYLIKPEDPDHLRELLMRSVGLRVARNDDETTPRAPKVRLRYTRKELFRSADRGTKSKSVDSLLPSGPSFEMPAAPFNDDARSAKNLPAQ